MNIAKSEVYDAIRKLKKIADPRARQVVLSAVHLHADGRQLVATATDRAIWLRKYVPCEGRLLACVAADALSPRARMTRTR